MKKNLKKRDVFFSSVIISTLIFFVVCLLTKGEIVTKVFLNDTQNTFMDHFNSIYDCFLKQPYDVNVMYPPLCNTIYWVLSKLIPKELFLSNWYTFPGGYVIRTNQVAILSVVILIGISILIILHVFISDKIAKDRMLLSFAIIFLMPVMFAIERGNLIILAVALLMLFIKYKDSNSIFLKEMAFISLAIASALKIYPAVFGLILLKQKRYSESIRTIIYGVLLFFVPFFLFGGVNAFIKLINNIIYASSINSNLGYGNKIGFINLFLVLIKKITGNDASFHLAEIANYIYLICLLLGFIFVKEKWKEYALLGLISINIVSFSYIYCILFLLPALYQFIDLDYVKGKMDVIYLILYIIMFIYVPIANEGFFEIVNEGIYGLKLYWDSFLKCAAINIFGILITIQVLISRITKKGGRRKRIQFQN